jgi:hypothetical protein
MEGQGRERERERLSRIGDIPTDLRLCSPHHPHGRSEDSPHTARVLVRLCASSCARGRGGCRQMAAARPSCPPPPWPPWPSHELLSHAQELAAAKQLLLGPRARPSSMADPSLPHELSPCPRDPIQQRPRAETWSNHRWRAMAAARVSWGVGERGRRGSRIGWHLEPALDLSPQPSQDAVGDRRAPYPPAIRTPPRIACSVLSTVEVKEMGRKKMDLPLADVQNHLPATTQNEGRGPYEQCHACHRTARII